MALMYPQFGPKSNDSLRAEPLVYKLLQENLDDNFHVVHSLPWLSSIVDEYKEGHKSPIGEIDFLIFHAQYGVLAMEVKGGNIKHNTSGFYYSNSKHPVNPERQLRRGTFAIQHWLEKNGFRLKIGHSYFFPDSEANTNELPPGVVDLSYETPLKLIMDINDIANIEKRIIGIMEYYRRIFESKPISNTDISNIIAMIIPDKDYAPCWYARIKNDERVWLKLTEEQQECVQLATTKNKFLVNGWPGSGKTIAAIQTARNLSQLNLNVLFITFNKLICSKIEDELVGYENVKTYTFHALCSRAAKYIGINNSSYEWLNNGAYEALDIAANQGFFHDFDVLVVDEGQAIKSAGWETLSTAFLNKKLVVMFDAAQSFPYEDPSSQEQLESYLACKPYLLTQSLRIPKEVCERLKLFKTPEYSITNPRTKEKDSLLELISADPEKNLRQLIIKLTSDNIPSAWITVLKPATMSVPASLVPQEIRVESIGRYRGMESPIIIILAASDMSDTELFCAYSRATSRCIIVLDAYDVMNEKYASLGKQLYKEQQNLVDIEAKQSLTKTIIQNSSLSMDVIVDGPITIDWCSTWNGYLLKECSSEAIRVLYKDYLLNSDTPLIYTWGRSDRKILKLIGQGKNSSLNLKLMFCQNCGTLCPHTLSSIELENYFLIKQDFLGRKFDSNTCIPCLTSHLIKDNSFEEICVTFNKMLIEPKAYSINDRKNVDPYIYSIGILINSNLDHENRKVIKLFENISDYGRVALALTAFYIHKATIKGQLTTFKISDVAKKTQLLNNHLNDMTFQRWQGYVNGAITNLEKIGAVETVDKGIRKVNIEFWQEITVPSITDKILTVE